MLVIQLPCFNKGLNTFEGNRKIRAVGNDLQLLAILFDKATAESSGDFLPCRKLY